MALKKNIVIPASKSRLTLSKKNGAIISLYMDGRELICHSPELFTLYFRDNNRDLFEITCSEFINLQYIDGSLVYSAHKNHHDLKVNIDINSRENYFCFKPSIKNIPEDITLDHIDLPQLTVSNNGQILYPFSEGVLVSDAARFSFDPISFPDRFYWWGYYPGICQMQFIAHYEKNFGVYFAAHDLSHTTKNIGFGNNGQNNVRLHLETYCGSENTHEYISDFEYIIQGFSGDWMDATELYRKWLWENSPSLKFKPRFPEWINDSPITVITPVRGTGTIKDEPNEYFPYENLMPHIERFADKFDSKIMSHLMRWDGNMPWGPPYIWPPMGGVEAMQKYLNSLHSQGHLLGLYGSGTSWTLKSNISSYSSEERYKNEDLQRYMTKGPKGEIKADICGRLRLGFGMCITEEWTREIFKKQVYEMASAGVDYIQLLDQNLGGCSFLCYSEDHSHPSIPGRWQTEAMKSFLTDLNNEIVSTGSEAVLGTECAAAEPYVGLMPLNDLRSVFAYHYGMPVPAYQYVFHEYCNDFMGNQAGVTNDINCQECPENMLWRIAYSFNAGTLLSVTMRNNGLIDWGAAADWDSPAPDQETIFTLIRNLNKLRKVYPQYLLHGKMIKPVVKLSGESYKILLKDREEIIDSFTHSSWRCPEGSMAQIITNYMPYVQEIECYSPFGYKVEISKNEFSESFKLVIPPLDAVVVKIIKDTEDSDKIKEHIVTVM